MTGKAVDDVKSLSPLDGRYQEKVKELRAYFSEAALIKFRLKVETAYLVALTQFLGKKHWSTADKRRLNDWLETAGEIEIARVKEIELQIKHDVKAVEYLIREKLQKWGWTELLPWVHWGLTSEDVNNLAYGLMVSRAWQEVLLPQQFKLLKQLLILAEKYKKTVMPGRTHGQLAVPTTLGKELIVFASRAEFWLTKLKSWQLGGKLNGAVGNFNSQVKIFPKKPWLKFSQGFVRSLGLVATTITTQIEPASRLVYGLDLLRQLNHVWLNLCQDIWRYISDDYLVQRPVAKEVGSSTMPHKVNPIDFENSEGNLELANSLLNMMSNKLAVSRLQRDLSDSTVKRNLGVALGHCLLALKSLQSGLNKIEANEKLMLTQVKNHPEMLSEAVQLWLKTKGEAEAYEKVKRQVRAGKKPVRLPKGWQVETYTGLAAELTAAELKRLKQFLQEAE